MEADRAREVWDRQASAWERNAQVLSQLGAPVTEWLVRRLDPHPGELVLEIAAGTADVGSRVSPLLGDRGRLIVSDLSPEMIAAASRRLRSLGLTNAEARVLDGEALDLPDGSVDAVVCRWGYMLMPKATRAFAETARVLRPGGRVALTVWGRAEANPWLIIPRLVARSTGLLDVSDPNEPGGAFSLATRQKLSGAIEGSGLQLSEVEELPVTIHFASFEQLWGYATEMMGGVSDALQATPDKAGVQAQLTQMLEPHRTHEGYVIPGLTLNALAQRP